MTFQSYEGTPFTIHYYYTSIYTTWSPLHIYLISELSNENIHGSTICHDEQNATNLISCTLILVKVLNVELIKEVLYNTI